MGRRPSPAVPPPCTLITLCAAVTVICLGLVAGQMDWADDDDDPGKFVFLSLHQLQTGSTRGIKTLSRSVLCSGLFFRLSSSLSSSSSPLGTSYVTVPSVLCPMSTLLLPRSLWRYLRITSSLPVFANLF